MNHQRLAVRAVALMRASSPHTRLPIAARLPHAALQRTYSSMISGTVLDPNLWKSLVPKALREARSTRRKSNEWNPATYFIWMFILIGSMSIHMIVLRNSTDDYMRQYGTRLKTLREVVEKIQNGQDVDVEEVLGTGNPQSEAEWKQVLQEVDHDPAIMGDERNPRPRSRKTQAQSNEQETSGAPAQPSEKKKTSGIDSFF